MATVLAHSWSEFENDDLITCAPESDKVILTTSTYGNLTDTGISDPTISINEIIGLNYADLSEIKILEYQKYVSFQIKKHIALCKNTNAPFDVEMHLPKLEWLLSTSMHLANKYNFKSSKKIKSKHLISRNSYKFCAMNSMCQVHNKTKNGLKCTGHHFVYDAVKSDIQNVIEYLNSTSNIDVSELFISMNTIAFVFNHMFDEMIKILNTSV